MKYLRLSWKTSSAHATFSTLIPLPTSQTGYHTPHDISIAATNFRHWRSALGTSGNPFPQRISSSAVSVCVRRPPNFVRMQNTLHLTSLFGKSSIFFSFKTRFWVTLSTLCIPLNISTFDPFGGVGAFGLGLEEAGCIKVTHAVEISPSASQTLQ